MNISRLRLSWVLPVLAAACLPRTDLDQHRIGSSLTNEDDGRNSLGAAGSAGTTGAGSDDDTGSPSSPSGAVEDRTPGEVVGSDSTTTNGTAGADAGPTTTADPTNPADAGSLASPEPDAAAVEPPILVPSLGPLPDDLLDAPVSGEITFSTEAVWEVDEIFEPTFEIHSPTASYWVVKPLGTIVSLEDGPGNTAQWLAFSSGFRPLRGVPALSTLPETAVTTVLDEETQTPTHLRLDARSEDGLWHWSWDFYVTQVTLTIWEAPVPTALGYRGVPGGELGVEDELRLGNGQSQGARNSFVGDLPGPQEWLMLTDTALERSLFAIQHFDDNLTDRYRVRDNDSAHWLFGDGQITSWPGRFSLGLIRSGDTATVADRIDFVVEAIRAVDDPG